tara:strand:- start:108 stop:548 length:441 start_codon:yes stop_codon:yes gene_type:complete
MASTSWKKELIVRGLPFVKKFANRVRKKIKNVDTNDLHDVGDVGKNAKTQSLLEKGLMLSVDLTDPISGATAIVQQSNPGEFLYEAVNRIPIFQKQETMPSMPRFVQNKAQEATNFLQNKIRQIGKSYEEYQLAKEFEQKKSNPPG